LSTVRAVGDDIESLVCLDVPAARVDAVAERAVRWLLERGVMVADPTSARADRLRDRTWPPGPRWLDVVRPRQPGSLSSPGPVDVETRRMLFHPVERYEPPWCGRCGTPLAEDAHIATFDKWVDGTEPDLVCAGCGWSAPVGDWTAHRPGAAGTCSTVAVGAPGITFFSWPPLRADFVAELSAVLDGGRVRLVRGHL
jgi:hypothetical protein